jgi:hypothetical protein
MVHPTEAQNWSASGVEPCMHWPREADDETSWIQACIADGIGLKHGE